MKSQSTRLKEIFYPASRFGGFSDVDGTVAFYQRVNALLDENSTVLDVGCGRGAYGEDPLTWRRRLRILKGKARCVTGLDVDPAGASNPYIDEFHLLEGKHWPVPNGSVDLLVSDSVLEHVEDPQAFFAEARRVLVDGGCLCLRTPNLWGYVAVLSKLVPNRAHVQVLERVKESTQAQDVFPTFYRANTLPRLRSLMRSHGFDAAVYGFGPEPSYLAFSKAAYALGVLYQRLAPGFLQPVIFAYGRARHSR